VRVHIEDEITVDAPVDEVWKEIKDPARHAEWHPFVTNIAGEHRLGEARKCAVAIGKRAAETKEVCTADEERKRLAWRIEEDSSGFLRMVSDWTAGFRLAPVDSAATRVVAESDFAPRNVLVRLMLPLVRRKFHQAQRAILDGLKDAAERSAAAT
jgi:carbon monoxide dehydrogenase subunit G